MRTTFSNGGETFKVWRIARDGPVPEESAELGRDRIEPHPTKPFNPTANKPHLNVF